MGILSGENAGGNNGKGRRHGNGHRGISVYIDLLWLLLKSIPFPSKIVVLAEWVHQQGLLDLLLQLELLEELLLLLGVLLLLDSHERGGLELIVIRRGHHWRVNWDGRVDWGIGGRGKEI